MSARHIRPSFPTQAHGLAAALKHQTLKQSGRCKAALPHTEPDDVFEENTACSSETFLIHEGVGLAGFEQNLIITKTGVEILTKTPMIFW